RQRRARAKRVPTSTSFRPHAPKAGRLPTWLFVLNRLGRPADGNLGLQTIVDDDQFQGPLGALAPLARGALGFGGIGERPLLEVDRSDDCAERIVLDRIADRGR